MKHIVKTEEEWHKLRKQCITASEAAVLVGADPYSSPAKIRNPSEFKGNAFTAVGQLLEPVVVNVTNQVLGTHFSLYETAEGAKEFYTEGNLGATPDAHQDHQILLECKTVNAKGYLKYSSVPPDKYLIQLMTQGICTEITEKTNYLALLNTGMKYIWEYEKFMQNIPTDINKRKWPITVFSVTQNNEICDILKREAERFTENKNFRVDSKIKQKVKLLLGTAWERVC